MIRYKNILTDPNEVRGRVIDRIKLDETWNRVFIKFTDNFFICIRACSGWYGDVSIELDEEPEIQRHILDELQLELIK